MVSKASDAVHQKPPDEDTIGPRPGHTLITSRVYLWAAATTTITNAKPARVTHDEWM